MPVHAALAERRLNRTTSGLVGSEQTGLILKRRLVGSLRFLHEMPNARFGHRWLKSRCKFTKSVSSEARLQRLHSSLIVQCRRWTSEDVLPGCILQEDAAPMTVLWPCWQCAYVFGVSGLRVSIQIRILMAPRTSLPCRALEVSVARFGQRPVARFACTKRDHPKRMDRGDMRG